jgi:hypothetical protein
MTSLVLRPLSVCGPLGARRGLQGFRGKSQDRVPKLNLIACEYNGKDSHQWGTLAFECERCE